MLDFYYALAWLLDRPLILFGGLAAYTIVTGTIVWIFVPDQGTEGTEQENLLRETVRSL